ncbi:MAG: metal-dependent hydrolase, partial [Pyrinomonadaceae bacterium]
LDLYRPADFNGKLLRLHYARADELTPYLGLVAAQGEMYVQFWLRAGERPVEVSFSDERPEEVIPGVLKQHL